jgi:hypothetical protein
MGCTFAEVRQTNASAERQPIPSRCATTHADATAGLAWLTMLAADERTICQRRLRHPAVRSQQKLAFGRNRSAVDWPLTRITCDVILFYCE